MLKTRYLEDELEHLEKNNELCPSQINLIKKTWHVSFNPTTNKYVYTHPKVKVAAKLRAKLIATIPFQPQTEMERIELEEKQKMRENVCENLFDV